MSIVNWYLKKNMICGDVYDGEKFVFIQEKFKKVDAYHVLVAGNVLEVKDEEIDGYFRGRLREWRKILEQ
jgi:hypothetical protein